MKRGRKLRRLLLYRTRCRLERAAENGDHSVSQRELEAVDCWTSCRLGTRLALTLGMPFRVGSAVRVSGGWSLLWQNNA